MHLKSRNVNDAFRGLVADFANYKDYPELYSAVPSRAGDVVMINEPVIITYAKPRERVLFNQARDCNPHFHLYESLWMLAGREDVEPLSYYSSGISDIASDDGKTFNGAYGYRWRHSHNKPEGSRTHGEFEGTDQLTTIVKHLLKTPNSRRVVLQMWNVQDDLMKVDVTKDVCCNLSALFSIRKGATDSYLDMTVLNRSNDLIWGALGANVVHFSFLQEYMASCLGVEVGVYNQMSNNMHVYSDRFEADKWLTDTCDLEYEKNVEEGCLLGEKVKRRQQDQQQLDNEIAEFVQVNSFANEFASVINYVDPFLQNVARPMMQAFHWHKKRMYGNALATASMIGASDWRTVSYKWIEKRKQMWEKKGE